MPESLPNEPAHSSSRDHSTLRARLLGHTLANRSIEAELRTAMTEREELESKEPETDRR